MLTYSDHNQQVIQSYGEANVQRLQQVQKAYDPTLVFQRLVTGGQKVPLYTTLA
jgi:Berberine and berberine like